MEFHLDWVNLASAVAVIGAIVVFIKKSAGVLTVKDEFDAHVALTEPLVRDWPFLKRRIRLAERNIESGEKERTAFRGEVLSKLDSMGSEIGELKTLIIQTLSDR